MMSIRKARYQRSDIVRFNLYEMFRRGKSIEIGQWLPTGRGGVGGMGA